MSLDLPSSVNLPPVRFQFESGPRWKGSSPLRSGNCVGITRGIGRDRVESTCLTRGPPFVSPFVEVVLVGTFGREPISVVVD